MLWLKKMFMLNDNFQQFNVNIFFLFAVKTPLLYVIFKELKIEGFTGWRFTKQWPEAFKEIAAWIDEVSSRNS